MFSLLSVLRNFFLLLALSCPHFACDTSQKIDSSEPSPGTNAKEAAPNDPTLAAGVDITFKVDSSIDPQSVRGYIVGQVGTLIVEPVMVADTKAPVFGIKNIPEGSRDLIVTAGTLAIQLSEPRNRGIRFSDLDVSKQKALDLGTVSLPETGSIVGIANLKGRTDHSGIVVYIPGTSYDARTDSNGNYIISNVPEGVHALRFESDGYHRGRLEKVFVSSATATRVGDVQLAIDSGETGALYIGDGSGIIESLSTDLTVIANEQTTLMQISERNTFDNCVWEPFRSSSQYTFKSPGRKKLFVRFANSNGLVSSPFGAEVNVTIFPANISLNIFSLRDTGHSLAIDLGMKKPKSAAMMLLSHRSDFSQATWTPASAEAIVFAPKFGSKSVFIKFKTEEGGESPVYQQFFVPPSTPQEQCNFQGLFFNKQTSSCDETMHLAEYSCFEGSLVSDLRLSSKQQSQLSEMLFSLNQNAYSTDQCVQKDETFVQLYFTKSVANQIYAKWLIVPTLKSPLFGSDLTLTNDGLSEDAGAPLFAGIVSSQIKSGNSALITWLPASIVVPVKEYRIWAKLGSELDFSAPPDKVVPGGVTAVILSGLGDELSYTFAVRACSHTDVCDANTQKLTRSTPDSGAPLTKGAIGVRIENGSAVIMAPWEPSHGAVKRRRIYQRTGTVGGTDIELYSLVRTFVVQDNQLSSVPNEIMLGGLQEHTTYHFMIRDLDPSGNMNTNNASVSITTTDLTPPSFGGILSLSEAPSGQRDSALNVEFQAIERESENSSVGASHYRVYLSSENGDACRSGSLVREIPANEYLNGTKYTVTLTNLSSRTLYSVCMKARDSFGNISVTSIAMSRSTLDLTAPTFDGIQALNFSPDSQVLSLHWNPSPAPDVSEYRIKIWKNSATPASGEITTFVRAAQTNRSGTTLSVAELSLKDSDTVYALVDACDDGQMVANGYQNCSAYSISAARFLTLADITPPLGFSGVSPASFFSNPSQGTVRVVWNAPLSWEDYRGFYVYLVDPSTNSLRFARDCFCSTNSCPEHLTACDISGLDARRTYRFHVRAYDNSGNITTYINPAISWTSFQTKDTSAPSFLSSLSTVYNNGVNIAWNPAVDNQYASESGAVISYFVYRKKDSSFIDPFQPQIDGTLLVSKTGLSHTDRDNLIQGQSTYYSMCVRDASNNRICDGNVQSLIIPDLTPPIFGSLMSSKTLTGKTWGLSWTLSDNVSPLDEIQVTVRASITDTAELATAMDPIIQNGVGFGTLSLTDLSGPQNANKYINYLITASDRRGNESSSSISVYSQNRISIDKIARNKGATAGNRLIYLTGAGFQADSVITLDGIPCKSQQFVDSTRVLCYTPAHAEGSVDVAVSNRDRSEAKWLEGYRYTDGDICDQTPGHVDFQTGSGTQASPYIICSAIQFDKIDKIGSSYASKYFELRDNIDLSMFSDNSFLPTSFAGKFEGNSYAIVNYSYSNTSASSVGLFSQISNCGSSIKNLAILNSSLKGGSYVGAIVGYLSTGSGCASIALSNIYASGAIEGSGSVGGAVGQIYRGKVNGVVANVSVISSAGTAGGFAGHIYYETEILNSAALGSVTSEAVLDNFGGFIGSIYSSAKATISNSIASGDVKTKGDYSGGFVGSNSIGLTSITNCRSEGNVEGRSYVGGFMGSSSQGVFDRIVARGQVLATSSSIGGLVGRMLGGTFSNSFASGDVRSLGGSVGGFVGNFSGTSTSIINSYAQGSVSGTANVGGFVGSLTGSAKIIGSYSKGISTASSSNSYVGGFVGDISSSAVIEKSYTTGNVTGINYVGGFAGRNSSTTATISKSYSQGRVIGTGQVGGFIGSNMGILNGVYSTGATALVVPLSANLVGGLMASQTGTTTDSFWDIEASEQTLSAGGTGYTSEELQNQNTFAPNWDFVNDWQMPANGGYPNLIQGWDFSTIWQNITGQDDPILR